MGKTKYQPLEYVTNPRDLVGDFVEQIQAIDPKAEYIVIVTDPRDRRSNTMHSCVYNSATRDALVRQVVNVMLEPPQEDDDDGD